MINWRKPILLFASGPGGHRLQSLCEDLRQFSYLKPEAIRVRNEKNLQETLEYAHRHVPYYRETFEKHGLFDKKNRFDREAFESIPLLDKQTIRDNFDALKANPLPTHCRSFTLKTSGSTGEVLRFLGDNHFRHRSTARRMVYFSSLGKEPGEPDAKLWGSPNQATGDRLRIKWRVRCFMGNRLWLNMQKFDDDRLRYVIERLNRHKPRLIWAHVKTIRGLAQLIEKENLQFHAPAAIVSCAEVLPEEVRQYSEPILGAPIYNLYASQEFSTLAGECKARNGLHLFEHSHFFEILRPDGTAAEDGEPGEIVVTSFHKRAMPMIRYRIGDMGTRTSEPCECGMGLARLSELKGRIFNYFLHRDGSLVAPGVFIRRMNDLACATKYKIVQREIDDFLIRLVIDPAADRGAIPHAYADMRRKIADAMGEGCTVTFEEVDDIPQTGSGKYQFTESKLL